MNILYDFSSALLQARQRKDVTQEQIAFASGGYVNYTGPAWVDGSPSSPEAFLSAQDTRNFEQLRDILSMMMANYQPGQNTQPTTSQDSYTIEISIGELGENYTVDDLVEELGEKIYNISTKGVVTRV